MTKTPPILPVAIGAFAIVAYLFLIDLSLDTFKPTEKANANTDDTVFCTQEAKLCPDGSYVGRQGPKCEFAPCPVGTNTNSSTTNTNAVVTPSSDSADGRKTYTNTTYGFSLKYPSVFENLTPPGAGEEEDGFRGVTIASALTTNEEDDAAFSLFVRDEVYSPATIPDFYGGYVPAERQTATLVGNRAATMFTDGDAGCGAREIVTSLSATKTLWLSFSDCDDEGTATSLFDFNDLSAVNAILSTVVFTE